MASRTNASTGEASVPLRSAKALRPLRSTIVERVAFLAFFVLLGGSWLSESASAQSSWLDHLGGFDSPRVERAARWVQQPKDGDALEEAAKLVYRVRLVERRSLGFSPEESRVEPGDAVRLRGTATHVTAVSLPRELADLLEMPRLFRVTIEVDGTDRYVMTERVPRRWLRPLKNSRVSAANGETGADAPDGVPAQAGQPEWSCAVEGVACTVDEGGEPIVLAAAAVQWYPASPEEAGAAGVALLARRGFDAGLIDQIAALQQQPLQSDERDAFYGMLAAAGQVERSDAPSPRPTETVELLRRPKELTGHWVRVPVRTVRITRVAVTTADELEQLGQDHYWQIDAMGTLGDVVVTVEVEGSAGRQTDDDPPVTFSGRYPVSIAALRLPEELAERVEQTSGAEAVVAMLRQPIIVDGFYYRLWSYDSEFMRRNAGRQQFGPLLMASQIRLQPAASGDSLGAAIIGWIAAAAFLIAVAAAVGTLWWTGRRDNELTRRRRAREAEDVQFPST